MKIEGADHIGINVSNMERALHFYHDLLKLPILREKIDNGDNDIYYLQLGADSRIELFDYHGSSEKKKEPEIEHRNQHQTKHNNDVDEWAAYLKEKGVPIRYGPESLTHLGSRVCLIEDPDGTEIEICAAL